MTRKQNPANANLFTKTLLPPPDQFGRQGDYCLPEGPHLNRFRKVGYGEILGCHLFV